MITMYEDYRAIMLNELERVYQYVNNHWFNEAEITREEKYKSITLWYDLDFNTKKHATTEIYTKENYINIQHDLYDENNKSIATFTIDCNIDDEIISKVATIEKMINEYNDEARERAGKDREYFKKEYGYYPNV